jgi:serine/threonine-protein kinase
MLLEVSVPPSIPPPSLPGQVPPSAGYPTAPVQQVPLLQPFAPPPPSMPMPGVAAPMPPPSAPSLGAPQVPQVGMVLHSAKGAYLLRDTIGAGEFGAVFEAIGPFDQVYALKWLRPAARPYAEVQANWAMEVQRLLSLRHPNVVYIHDAFTHGQMFYLALERCDHALTSMLGTPMQEGLIIELCRQTLAAVQFLHDSDVIHDDLHPGNVLVTHTDRPTIKISDFGISHVLEGALAVRPNVVHHAIMAPEILETGFTTKQSDLYQVGLLAYWMLTGTPALDMNASYPELMRQVSEGHPRLRAESLGTPLGDIVARMLRRREQYRFASAREVWNELRELPGWRERELFPAK